MAGGGGGRTAPADKPPESIISVIRISDLVQKFVLFEKIHTTIVILID